MCRPYLDIFGFIYQNGHCLRPIFPFLCLLLSRPVPSCSNLLGGSITCPSGFARTSTSCKMTRVGADDNFLISLGNRASDSDCRRKTSSKQFWRRLSKAAPHSVTLMRHGFSGSLTSCGRSHGTAFTKAPYRTIRYCRALTVRSLTQVQADAEHC